MKQTKTMVFFSLISMAGLIYTTNPAIAFPFNPGNNNSGSSACYHNGAFYGMAWGGASCPEIPYNDPKHAQPDANGNVPANKHTPEDCVIIETPFND